MNLNFKNKSLKCPSCNGLSKIIGQSFITDQKIKSFEGQMLYQWLKTAKSHYDYVHQKLYICTNCGLLFIYPILDDDITMELIFKSYNNEPKKSINHLWEDVEFYGQPSIWNLAVRVPSYNLTLEPFIPKHPVRLLDVGAHGGQISLNLALPENSKIDLLQMEESGNAYGNYKKDVRQFFGKLKDLPSEYKADIILALHVLEHTDNPKGFLKDLEKILSDDGLIVIEVPYELHEAISVASDMLFEIPHNFFFTPESLKLLISQTNLHILDTFVDFNSNTGVGENPYPIIRLVCSHAKTPNLSQNSQKTLQKNLFPYTIDRLFKNFSGSLAFHGKVKFKVFVFNQKQIDLVKIFEDAPGFKGLVTSNKDLKLDDVFTTDLKDIDYVFTLPGEDRSGLLQSLHGNFKIQ